MPRKDTINRFDLQESWDFTWRVSDCEELVGVTWRVSDCEELVGPPEEASRQKCD